MSDKRWHYQHEESMSTIASIASDLLELSTAFSLIGNGIMSNTLFNMATNLAAAATSATQARRGQLDELYNNSQADVSSMLSALLNSAT